MPSARVSDLTPTTVAPAAGNATAGLRLALVGGCVAAVALAAALGSPQALLAADPELAQLLRFMAMIKAGMVAVAIVVLYWRFGFPIGRAHAGAYLGFAWFLAAAATSVWQLSFIGPAAVLFHTSELALLLIAWLDRGPLVETLRRSPMRVPAAGRTDARARTD